jgi:hypothetical protein
MEDDGTFYDHLVDFVAVWITLWPFGLFYGHLVYFFPFWYVVLRKIWQPWSERRAKNTARAGYVRPCPNASDLFFIKFDN